MQALESIKQQTDDENIKKDIDLLQRQINELPERIEEKRLLRKRARENFMRR